MPRHFISFRVLHMQFSPACEYFLKSNSEIKQILKSEISEQKVKRLDFQRDTKEGLIVEKYKKFFVMSSFDEAEFFVPEIFEYKRLKFSLAYGLKAGASGVSAQCALRIFIYFLLSNNRFKDALSLLKICPNDLFDKALAKRIGDPIDLLAIAMDKEGQYLKTTSSISDYSNLIKMLLLQDKKLNLILEFANFFKEHKKATDKAGALKILKKVEECQNKNKS